jgi:ABC-type histidine transport system ATPase subunit
MANGTRGAQGSRGADLDVRAITKRFGTVVAVEAVSFTVRAGDWVSFGRAAFRITDHG